MRVAFLFSLLLSAGFGTATVAVDCSSGSWGILETLPPDLGLPLVGANSTYAGWLRLLADDPRQVRLAALWAQLEAPPAARRMANVWRGQALNKTLEALKGRADMAIVTNDCRPAHAFFHASCGDVLWWGANDVMDVNLLNFSALVSTPPNRPMVGFLHAKVISTLNHGYSGSANMAYTSLSQTKELGIVFYQCPQLASIFTQVSDMWTYAGKLNSAPSSWPAELQPKYGRKNPLSVQIRSDKTGQPETLNMYPCYSPTPLNYQGAASDCIDVLVSHMNEAEEFIRLEAMQVSNETLYQSFGGLQNFGWSTFDDALRAAAARGVKIQIMVSNWTMTIRNFPQQMPYWRSLDAVENIEVRQFRMPADSESPALSRVNHNKFFITDKVTYISTSNWTPDYYLGFAGFDWTIQNDSLNSVHDTLLQVFERDWNSPYVVPLFPEA